MVDFRFCIVGFRWGLWWILGIAGGLVRVVLSFCLCPCENFAGVCCSSLTTLFVDFCWFCFVS